MRGEGVAPELESLVAEDPRYKLDAYLFVMNGLEYTLGKLGRVGHLSGAELLDGLKDYARANFGPTARMVLEHWGVTRTEDFGEIVFKLVDRGILGKTERDSIEDFREVYDFGEVFDKQYDWKSERGFERRET